MRFEPGFVVQLKSGGPPMTVVAEDAEGIRCLYCAEINDEIRTAVIPAVALELVEMKDDESDDDEEDEDEDD
jgi:hypothetical protein